MNITTIGRGTIGRGLAKNWQNAGHEVTLLGRDGGDASHADVLLIAVPGMEISPALSGITGLEGKIAIDATNVLPTRHGEFPSYAHEVQSFTKAPVAKAFNLNFGRLLGEAAAQRVRPSNWFVADPDARALAETLITDAGYDPIHLGDLSRARSLEDMIWVLLSIEPAENTFYRFAKPGEL